ncbi:hypothetical protein PFLU4_24700 [Pseudomonas fluorescens]|nr:hypothetical protein PFLU4_24700 [Pseudomonas fluorescens]
MLTASFLISFLVCIIAGIIYLLSKKNGRDIRVVWYLSSLTIMITFGVAWMAISAGAIKEGQFVGEYGDFLNSVIDFMFDLEKDFLFFTGIASLIMVPQFACYILSGLSGNAKSPMLMSASLSFLFWGIIKSLVVCASVLVSLGGLCLLGYLSESGHTSLFFVVTGLYSLTLAFGIIFLYREGEQLARCVGKYVPFLKAVHIWFTRKEKTSNSEELTDEVDLLELSLSLLSVTSEIQQVARKYKAWKSPSTER